MKRITNLKIVLDAFQSKDIDINYKMETIENDKSLLNSKLNNDLELRKRIKPLIEEHNVNTKNIKDVTLNILSLKIKYDSLLLRSDSLIFDLLVLLESVQLKIKLFII